jgi:hypothetical protein
MKRVLKPQDTLILLDSLKTFGALMLAIQTEFYHFLTRTGLIIRRVKVTREWA